jgi:hypothetical protein
VTFVPQWWNAEADPDDPHPENVVRHCVGSYVSRHGKVIWLDGHNGSHFIANCPKCVSLFSNDSDD